MLPLKWQIHVVAFRLSWKVASCVRWGGRWWHAHQGTHTQSFSDSLEKLRAMMGTVMCASNWHSHQGTCMQSFSDSWKIVRDDGYSDMCIKGHVNYVVAFRFLKNYARWWVQLDSFEKLCERMGTVMWASKDTYFVAFRLSWKIVQDDTYSSDMHIKGHTMSLSLSHSLEKLRELMGTVTYTSSIMYKVTSRLLKNCARWRGQWHTCTSTWSRDTYNVTFTFRLS